MYLVWFIIEVPFIYERFFVEHSFQKGMLLFIRGVLISNTFYASWYITATWQATLIVYYLSKYNKRHLLLIVAIICAFMSVTNSLYHNLFDNKIWNLYTLFTGIICASNSFVAAIPYCIIGKYIAEHQQKITKFHGNLSLIALSIIVCTIELALCKNIQSCTDSYLTLYLLAFSVCVFLISNNIKLKFNIAKLLRKMSILIYLLHGIAIRILEMTLGLHQGRLLFLLTLIMSVVASFIIVNLSNRFKILSKLH